MYHETNLKIALFRFHMWILFYNKSRYIQLRLFFFVGNLIYIICFLNTFLNYVVFYEWIQISYKNRKGTVIRAGSGTGTGKVATTGSERGTGTTRTVTITGTVKLTGAGSAGIQIDGNFV